jgi:anti-sigma B factor antagonist
MARFEAMTSGADPDRIVVALAGECDLTVRDELVDALLPVVERAPVVVVDVGGLEFLDSSGINGLITAHRAAVQRGARMYLVNATGVVAELLAITGVGDLLRPPDGAIPEPGVGVGVGDTDDRPDR